DGLLLVAPRLLEGLLAIAHSGARAGAKGGDVLGSDHGGAHYSATSPSVTSSTASPSTTEPSLRRRAIASGLARRRRWRRFLALRSSELAGSAPRSDEYVYPPSPSSPSSRTGDSRRASMILSAIAAVFSSTERIASSLPAIGTVIRSGSELVSQMAIIGMPSLFASSTAIFSFLASTTKRRPGTRDIFLMPERFFASLSRWRAIMSCSFLV